MRMISFIILGLVLAQPAISGEKEFLAWWKSSQTQEQAGEGTKYCSKQIELSLNGLQEQKKRKLKKPVAIKKEVEAVLVIHSQKDLGLLLVTPQNILKDITTIDDQYYETMKKCAEDRSWIVMTPKNIWSEIDLNPYCTMAYGEDDIAFTLSWVEKAGPPVIEVATKGAECTPRKLYGWDKKANKYALLAEKCTN